ncbi:MULTISPECIES: chemotaxis protein CheB [Aerosakkonema]|uniref:chemotaxis protein CheB n=1 Tax=Aerosakkonema TaxID=1246629 RepID=UPI0035B94715
MVKTELKSRWLPAKPEDIMATECSISPAFDIVALAASAGGLNALSCILSCLPTDFPAGIVVVQHMSRQHRSFLAEILNRRTPLPVKQAEEGEQLIPGTVYLAAPDRHLLVNLDGTLSLTQTEKVHSVRPSAEILFKSVAKKYHKRAIAVVLTGANMDGSKGVEAIKKMGGKVIAQDESTSEVFGMPAAAIQTGCVDWILPLDKIADAIKNLVMGGQI